MTVQVVISAAVVAAIISGLVSLVAAIIARNSALAVRDKQTAAESKILAAKIEADYQLALRKVEADVAARLGERAWADYGLRRDAYVSLARLINVLFEGQGSQDQTEFHRVARQIRLVGSDEVVTALNALTNSIKTSASDRDVRYRALFNAMRRDIRRIHSLPPEGTDLGVDAFPIES